MNMKKIFCILPLLIILTSAGAQVSVSLLRCEQLEDPMGIDVRSPGLSWQIQSAEKNVQQTAYQVIVSSTREKLEANQGDLWNSGQVPSSYNPNPAMYTVALFTGEGTWKLLRR